MNPVKLGIIGCGIAARDLHWPALKVLKDKFEIVTICNHTEEKAKSFAKLIGGVPYVLDYKELLKRPEIEAVDIMLPINLNYQAVRDSLEAGKHVFAEKPIASSLKDAGKMVAMAKEYNHITMIAENFRYRKVFGSIKSIIEEGKIGEPYAVLWNNFSVIDPSNNEYARTDWRIHHQYPGGFVTDAGVHNMAALRDMFGEITVIGAFTKQVNPAIGELDSLSFQFKTENHICGVFNIFFGSNGFSENRLIISGKKGSIIFDEDMLTVKQGGNTLISENFKDDNGYRGEFEDFYEGVRNGRPVKSTFFDAYGDLKILLDALNIAVK